MTNTERMAALAVNRPETFLRTCAPQDIIALRIYPNALMALWRADNCPKKLKFEIEDMLEIAGFKIMT